MVRDKKNPPVEVVVPVVEPDAQATVYADVDESVRQKVYDIKTRGCRGKNNPARVKRAPTLVEAMSEKHHSYASEAPIVVEPVPRSRPGTFIQTVSGRNFYPLDPRPDGVYIRDIAYALAHKCRYTGHSLRFYSVAEHCCILHDYFLDNGDATTVGGTKCEPWALLHDAAEAYLPDVAGPIKQYFKGFAELEDRVLRAIGRAIFLDGLPPANVMAADKQLYAAEEKYLMPYRHSELVPIMERRCEVAGMPPHLAYHEFMLRYRWLAGNGFVRREKWNDQ